MKTITLKLYGFNQLSKDGKRQALTTYRGLNVNFDWWDDEFEDFVELCSYMGITVNKDTIKFRGFYGQGDGSAFSAAVDLVKLRKAIKTQAWKCFAPLQEFPFNTAEIDRRIWKLLQNGKLPKDPKIIGRQRQFNVIADLGVYVQTADDKTYDNIFEELDRLEEWLRVIAETLNHNLFNTLEKQYEYLISDTTIAESIVTNEYLFTSDGRTANHLTQLATIKN